MRPNRGAAGLVLAGLVTALSSGCTYKGRLADYDFRDRTIALLVVQPGDAGIAYVDGSEVDSGDGDGDDGLSVSLWDAVSWVATTVLESHEIGEAEAKLRAASQLIDVATIVGEDVLYGFATELGVPVVVDPEQADYTLQVSVPHYGLDVAPSWEETGFTVVAVVDLLDPYHPDPIWSQAFAVTDAGSDPIIGGSSTNSALIALDLSTTSAEDMAETLERLAHRAAERAVQKFHDSMEAVRD